MDQMYQQPNKSSEQLPAPEVPGESLPTVAPLEALPVDPETGERERGNAGAAVQQAYSDDVVAAQAAAGAILVNDATQVAQTTTPTQADIDVIEKEWVEKAKNIVAKTKDDPRQQSVELTGMKREYVEKRFGKVLPDNRAA